MINRNWKECRHLRKVKLSILKNKYILVNVPYTQPMLLNTSGNFVATQMPKYKAISFLLAQAFVVFIGIFVLCKKQNITTKKLNEAAFKNSAINNAVRTTRGKEKKQRATSECEFCSVCLNFAKQKQHNKCAFKQKVILRQFKKELHLK